MTEWNVATAPGALPLLGHALKLRHGLLRYVETLPAHGDLVRVRFGPWPVYMVCHPDLVQHVLRNDRVFDKGGPVMDKLREVVGDGLGTCPHSKHRRQRRLVQPAFHRNRMPGYAQVMSTQIAEFTQSWRDGQRVDVPAQMKDLIGGIIAKTVFTSQAAAPAARTMQKCLDPIMSDAYLRAITPPALLGLVPTHYLGVRAHRRMHAAIDATIEAYRKEGIDHGDMLSMLLSAHNDETAKPLSAEEIHDQVTIFLVAGIVTSAATLSWALDLLAHHPDVLAALHAEVDTVLGGRVADWHDLANLPLTGRIIEETLRLFPPAWILSRVVTESTELGGHHLPAGTTIVFSPYLLHHLADQFPCPDRFDPDRWLPESVATRPRNTFVAFASGPRKCIGDTYAITVTTLALASITARWSLQPASTAVSAPAAQTDLIPKKLRMSVHRRDITTHPPAYLPVHLTFI